MLWACELKPNIWWTDDFSLIRICIELLHDLAVWLTKQRCPHYFINSCNLIDSSFNLDMIHRRLTSISKSWLSSWFVDNYIRKCSQLCPHNVSRLFADAITTKKLQNAVSAIVDWRLHTILHDMFRVFLIAECDITRSVSTYALTEWSLVCWLSELRKSSTSLPVCFYSVALLHVACRIHRSGVSDVLMDMLAVLVGQSVGLRRYSYRRISVLFLGRAANLMKAVADRPKSHSTVDLIAIELSKAYLYRSLSCEDSDSDSVYTAWQNCLLGSFVLHHRTVPDGVRSLCTGDEIT